MAAKAGTRKSKMAMQKPPSNGLTDIPQHIDLSPITFQMKQGILGWKRLK
jgi:hypothetical protein